MEWSERSPSEILFDRSRYAGSAETCSLLSQALARENPVGGERHSAHALVVVNCISNLEGSIHPFGEIVMPRGGPSKISERLCVEWACKAAGVSERLCVAWAGMLECGG